MPDYQPPGDELGWAARQRLGDETDVVEGHRELLGTGLTVKDEAHAPSHDPNKRNHRERGVRSPD